ncbi:MAG: 2-hydroxyacid dehydrogenase [bacterium]
MGERVVLIAFDPTDEDRELARSLEKLATIHFKEDLSKRELPQVLAQTEVLIAGGWRGTIDSEMVSSMPRLRLIQTLAAGVNHVPFSSLSSSVAVSTGSGANSPEIAEHVFALILSAAKNVVKHTRAMRKSLFPQGEESKVLRERTLGILGVGSVGSHVARLGRCFNMKVHGCDIRKPSSVLLDRFYQLDALRDFLREVDFLVICVPLTRRTKGMIGKDEISSMKTGAVLVNVSRGAVIREKDLFDHLQGNPRFTACLDVWWKYTPDRKFIQNYPFEKLDNVVMTPHNAAFYPGYHKRMVQLAFEKVARYLRDEPLEGLADPSHYA